MKLFGSSGIRGVVNIDLTPELALDIGRAAGMGCSQAVLARDSRISGVMVESAVASGLMASGCSVTKLGVVPTPTLAYAACGSDLGVMITASHNPAEYNGVKLWNPDGIAFDSDQQEKIERTIGSGNFIHANWSNIGTMKNYENAIDDHINKILDNIEMPAGTPRVVVDCGNGAGYLITPLLLRRMGCRVLALNAQPDGHFPARNPEPVEANLDLLMKTVRNWRADVGLAHDGDADRLMAVDERGRFVGGDQLLAIFAAREDKQKIVVPVDTSMVVDDALPGTRVLRSRVGDVYVAECMKKEGAGFGGEPSGSWIFPGMSFCPDGVYAAARLIEIIGEGKLSEQVDALPQYETRRTGIACDNKRKADIMSGIAGELSALGEVSIIDGVRVADSNGWILVRASGTEPKIRVTAEARKNVEALFQKACSIVKREIGSTCG